MCFRERGREPSITEGSEMCFKDPSITEGSEFGGSLNEKTIDDSSRTTKYRPVEQKNKK